jgi:hypothetical protein
MKKPIRPIIIRTGNVSIMGLLGVLFVGLKLTNVIDWSWLWVTCPFWIGFVFIFLCVVGGFGIAGLFLGLAGLLEWIDRIWPKKRTRKNQTDKDLYEMLKKRREEKEKDEWNTF